MGKVVVVATRNKGKLKEFRAMFEPIGYEVKGIDDLDATLPDVVEDASTFEGNALKKAKEMSLALGVAVIADDSGLCVEALHGEPGVYSARYAGEHATDETNLTKVLQTLDGKTSAAQYVCVLAFVDGERNPNRTTWNRGIWVRSNLLCKTIRQNHGRVNDGTKKCNQSPCTCTSATHCHRKYLNIKRKGQFMLFLPFLCSVVDNLIDVMLYLRITQFRLCTFASNLQVDISTQTIEALLTVDRTTEAVVLF
jgi:non-canonical purine NTP pyrophosphatase (RdgB/HAM1 family)